MLIMSYLRTFTPILVGTVQVTKNGKCEICFDNTCIEQTQMDFFLFTCLDARVSA